MLTESVTNIVGRADLLAGMGVLGGLLLYLKSTDHTGWRRWAYLGGLSAVTAVGVFSKESAVMVLPVIVLYEAIWWKQRRQVRGLIWGSLAMLVPIQAMLYQRAAVLWSAPADDLSVLRQPDCGGRIRGRQAHGVRGDGQVRGAAGVAGAALLRLFVGADSAGGQRRDGLARVRWRWRAALAAGVLLWRGSRNALFVAGAALLVFLPTSNLLFPIGTIMAERFLYLPAIAFAAGVVAAVYAAGKRAGDERLAPVLLGLIAMAFAARTWVRNLDWRDDLSIGRAAVQASPASFKSHKLLAYALHESDAEHANIDARDRGGGKGAGAAQRAAGCAEQCGQLPAHRRLLCGARRAFAAEIDIGQRAESAKAYRRALELLLRSRAMATAQTNGRA